MLSNEKDIVKFGDMLNSQLGSAKVRFLKLVSVFLSLGISTSEYKIIQNKNANNKYFMFSIELL